MADLQLPPGTWMITAQHRAGMLCPASQSSFPDNILQWNSSLPLQHLLYQGSLSNLVWLLCLATWIPSYIFQLKPSEKWPQLSPILWAQLSFHVLYSIIDNCYFICLGFVSRWKVKSTLVEPLIRGQIVNTLIEIVYVSMNFNKIFFLSRKYNPCLHFRRVLEGTERSLFQTCIAMCSRHFHCA